MTTSGSERVLVDTNVLLYAHLSRSPLHAPAYKRLQELEGGGAELWISRQTVREFLMATTTPGTLTAGIPIPALVKDVRHMLGRFQMAEDGPKVTDALLFLLGSIPITGKQINDANQVATMQAHGIGKLLTHNTADFARFAALIIVVPMVVESPAG